MEMAREIQYPHPRVLSMNTTQTTVDVKRFLKEKIRDELVPTLEQLVDELPDDLVGFICLRLVFWEGQCKPLANCL